MKSSSGTLERFLSGRVASHMALPSLAPSPPARTQPSWWMPPSMALDRPVSVSQSSAMRKWPRELASAPSVWMCSSSCVLDISASVPLCRST